MSDSNGTTQPTSNINDENVAPGAEAKGKGKVVASELPEVDMEDEEDDEEDDDEEVEGDAENAGDDFENEEEDGMEEIDTENIISGGRRTRGKTIDFAKAAKETPEDEEEDESDDGDFEAPEEDEMRE